MKNLSYNASMTRQLERLKGVNLAKKGVEILISLFYWKFFVDIIDVYFIFIFKPEHFYGPPYLVMI